MSSPFNSIALRLPHVRGVWPWDDASEKEKPANLGPIIEPGNLPSFPRIFIRVEWPSQPRENPEVWLYAFGVTFGDDPQTIILAQQRRRPHHGDWPEMVRDMMERFRADYVYSPNDEVNFSLEVLNVGPTLRQWADIERERMMKENFRNHHHMPEQGPRGH